MGNRTSYAGGGDEPESQIDALFESLQMNFSPDSKIIIILITDASPHDPDAKGRRSDQFIELAIQHDATINIVGPNLNVYQNMVNSTNGQLIDISDIRDMSLILETLGQAIINIATELSTGNIQII